MPSIDVSNTTLHHTDSGPRDAPAVLLSHSLFFDHAMFDAQVAHLSATHRVVAYDHRGQGRSAAAPREELDMDTLTQDAVGLIEALGLRDVTVVGNSMGGFVALRLAARHPDLVRSAVVAGSSADVEEQTEAAVERLTELDGRLEESAATLEDARAEADAAATAAAAVGPGEVVG